jgi:hypothetical protein
LNFAATRLAIAGLDSGLAAVRANQFKYRRRAFVAAAENAFENYVGGFGLHRSDYGWHQPSIGFNRPADVWKMFG